MKAMILQPINGKTDEEIVATREQAITALEGKGYKIYPIFPGEWFGPEVCEQLTIINPPL